MKKVILLLGFCMVATLALGESMSVDYYSSESIQTMSRALALQAASSPEGIAPKNLETYPNHYTMLTVRTKDGGAELHLHDADIFIVEDGAAILVTGGTIENAKSVSEGETRGSSVIGGKRQPLQKGDVVHIPPGVPHQLLVQNGKPFAYFVIKVHE